MTEENIIKVFEKYHTYIDNNKAELHSDSYHEVAKDILRQINLSLGGVMPCLDDIQDEAWKEYYKGYGNPITPCDADKYGHEGFVKCGKWILSLINKA